MDRRYVALPWCLLLICLAVPGHAQEPDPLLPCLREKHQAFPDLSQEEIFARCRQDQAPSLTAGTIIRDPLADGGEGPAMVVIAGGLFQMGSPPGEADRDETERLHRDWVEPFLMGQTEVSFAEYGRFARATGRDLPDDKGWGRDDRPVINVSWLDASAYAEWLSAQTRRTYRLPTEAEWEYAARGGTETARWWGDEIGENHANCAGCGSRWDRTQTAPVRSFPANPFGLHEVLGNVWEWTCSDFDKRYRGEQEICSERGDEWFRVARGGAWRFAPQWVRSATRNGNAPGSSNSYIGFRVAATLE